MTSTNDGKDVKSNQTSGTKGKSFYIELYKSLEAGLNKDSDLSERTRNLCEAWRRIHSLCTHSAASTHPHLLSWLQRHTSRTVLQTEWQDPENKKEHKRLEEAIDDFVKESQSSKDGDPPWQTQLVARGEWFKRILASPWGHPVLRILLDSKRKESPKDEEILEWLKEERGVMFVTRLRQLASSKDCKDLALELASSILDRVRACVDPPNDNQADEVKEKKKNGSEQTFMDKLKTEAGFTIDVMELLTDIEFVLLHKRNNVARCIELAKQTPLRNGYQLVERLQSRQETSPREKKLWKNAKEVATLIAQVVVARCMVVGACGGAARTALYCCARSLARLLGAARLAPAAAALAAPAATAKHLHTLALAVDSESNDEMKPFVCELYVRAITAGMNELERLKLNAAKEQEARSSEQTLSQWFVQLGTVLAASERMRCECILTAFSVHPSPIMYEKIKLAPNLTPVALDIEPKSEEATSEFGSWASDSRSQTNFVKTSETLKLKQTQHQTNVLSTAILTEGETLQLSPELCQDITVLLSGPRVKTLSWDMDRQLLLENCRIYMERTHCGTRALTTELKYLNLDLRMYQHLPEEDEDDSDIYYGIEKGYEHLVEFQEPEKIWRDADDSERTESATNTTDAETEIITKTKRKPKKILISSAEDEDPLSTVAEAKRVVKKKERPHSKERSKVSKSYSNLKDPLEINDNSIEGHTNISILYNDRTKDDGSNRSQDHNTDRTRDRSIEKTKVNTSELKKHTRVDKKKATNRQIKKDNTHIKKGKDINPQLNKEESQSNDIKKEPSSVKKKERKPRDKDKNKEKRVRKRKEKTTICERKPSSLSNLIGMKVTKIGDNNKPVKSTFTDSDYDSQGKSSMHSLPSEGTETDVLFDGLFSMDELKSPEIIPDNIEDMEAIRNNHIRHEQVKLMATNKRIATDRMPTATFPSISTRESSTQPKLVTTNEEVKHNIKKLILFRRQRAAAECAGQNNLVTHMDHQSYINKSVKPQNLHMPVNDTTKVYMKKSQSQPLELKNEVSSLVINKDVISPINKQNRPTHTTALDKLDNVTQKKILNNNPSGIKILNSTIDKPLVQKPSINNDSKTSFRVPAALNRQIIIPSTDPQTHQPVQGHQKNFHDFLKDLQASINAGTDDDALPLKKETKPIIRTNPVMLKSERKVSQSAKLPLKKPDVAPNTFSRLNYYKSNRNDVRTKLFVEAVVESQAQLLEKKPLLRDLNLAIAQHSQVKVKHIQASKETVRRTPKTSENTQKVMKKTSTAQEHPLVSGLVQTNSSLIKSSVVKNSQVIKNKSEDISSNMPNKRSCLTEKDQQDLVLLLRQQSKQNLTKPKVQTSKERVQPNDSNMLSSSNMKNSQNKTESDCKSVIIKNPSVTKQGTCTKSSQEGRATKPDILRTAVGDLKRQEKKDNRIQISKFNKTENKRMEAKVIVKQQEGTKQTDWESVMDALLKHKTPSRGPNALDMALNKDTYLSAYENSLRNPRLIEPTSDSTSDPVTPGVAQELRTIDTEALLGTDMKHSDHNPSLLKKANVTGQKIVSNPILGEPSSSASISGLQCQENLSSIDTPKKKATPVSKKLHTDLKKQQFTCPLPKEDDPFISGNLNTDYDLLHELIDDDLRQEIGELLSDDDCYAASAPCLKDSQTFISPNKTIVPGIHEDKESIALPILNTNFTKTNKKKASHKISCNNVPKPVDTALTVEQSTGYIDVQIVTDNTKHSKAQSIPNVRTANIVQQIPASIIMPPKIEQTYISSVRTVDPTFVALPQPTALQNVVLIGSELVYQPCVRAPLPTGLPPSAYVAINTQPNIALYRTTQFAAPVVNPLIIGNAMTSTNVPLHVLPVNAHATSNKSPEMLNQSFRTSQAPEISSVQVSENVKNLVQNELRMYVTDTKNGIDQLAQNNTAEKERNDNNCSKQCERKVLSEVQEKQKLTFTEKFDAKTIKTQLLSFDDNIKQIDDHERLNKKRMAILNRNIYHRSDNTPIPLSYTPLKHKKDEVTAPDEKLHNLSSTVTGGANDRNVKLESVINTEVRSFKGPDQVEMEKDGNENCKENKNKLCRRILLRSSNKVSSGSNERTLSTEGATRKSKVRLKVVGQNSDAKESTINKAIITKKRTLKKSANKTIKKIVKRRKTRHSRKNTTKDNTGEKSIKEKIDASIGEDEAAVRNDTVMCVPEVPDVMDIEDQIIGSKILKKTSLEPGLPDIADALTVNNDFEDVSLDVSISGKTGSSDFSKPQIYQREIPVSESITTEKPCEKNGIKVVQMPIEHTGYIQVHTVQTEGTKECADYEDNIIEESCSQNQLNEEHLDQYKNTLDKESDKGEVNTALGSKEPDINKEITVPKKVVLETEINEMPLVKRGITDTAAEIIEKTDKEKSAIPRKTSSQIESKSRDDPEVICLDDNRKSDGELKALQDNDKIPRSFLDAIKIEDLRNTDPNDPSKKCVRIKLPNGRAFKATVRGHSQINFKTLFADPSLRKVLLNNISSRNRYTLNIKQISTAAKSQPEKILETRIQKISFRAPKSLSTVEQTNCLETINLLSDDEEDNSQSFDTEFGKYKVPAMEENLYKSHQNIFNKKCVIKLKRGDHQLSDQTESEHEQESDIKTVLPDGAATDSISPLASVVTAAPTIATEFTTTVAPKLTATIDQEPAVIIAQELSATKASELTTTRAQEIIPPIDTQEVLPTSIPEKEMIKEGLETQYKPFNSEVIEIDDSSNDDQNLNEVNLPNDRTKTCEEKIREYKNLLLKDLGVEDVDDSLTSTSTPTKLIDGKCLISDSRVESVEDNSEEVILPDILTKECTMRLPNAFESNENLLKAYSSQLPLTEKKCFVKLTNCDGLVETYNNLKLIKECSVNLVRCEGIQYSSTQINHNSGIDLDVVETSSINSLPENTHHDVKMLPQPLCRSGSFSILDDYNMLNELTFSKYIVRTTSPVMDAYETIAAVCNPKTNNKLREFEQCACETEWFLSKSLIYLQQKKSIDDATYNVNVNTTDFSALGVSNAFVPKLVTILTKYFQNNPIVDNYTSIYCGNSTYSLKRKPNVNDFIGESMMKKSKNEDSGDSILVRTKVQNKPKDMDVTIDTKHSELSNEDIGGSSKINEDLSSTENCHQLHKFADKENDREVTDNEIISNDDDGIRLPYHSTELKERNAEEISPTAIMEMEKFACDESPLVYQRYVDTSDFTRNISIPQNVHLSGDDTFQFETIESINIHTTFPENLKENTVTDMNLSENHYELDDEKEAVINKTGEGQTCFRSEENEYATLDLSATEHNKNLVTDKILPESHTKSTDDKEVITTETDESIGYSKDIGLELNSNINQDNATYLDDDKDTVISPELTSNTEMQEQVSNYDRIVLNEPVEIYSSSNQHDNKQLLKQDMRQRPELLNPNDVKVKNGILSFVNDVISPDTSNMGANCKQTEIENQSRDFWVVQENSNTEVDYPYKSVPIKKADLTQSRSVEISCKIAQIEDVESPLGNCAHAGERRENDVTENNEIDVALKETRESDFDTLNEVTINVMASTDYISTQNNSASDYNSGTIKCNISDLSEVVTTQDHTYTLNEHVKATKEPENLEHEVMTPCHEIDIGTNIGEKSNDSPPQDLVEDIVDMNSDEILEEDHLHTYAFTSSECHQDNETDLLSNKHDKIVSLTSDILTSHICNNNINVDSTSTNLVKLLTIEQVQAKNKKCEDLIETSHDLLNKGMPKSFQECNSEINVLYNSDNYTANTMTSLEEIVSDNNSCEEINNVKSYLFGTLSDGIQMIQNKDSFHKESNITRPVSQSKIEMHSVRDKSCTDVCDNQNDLVEDVIEMSSKDELEQELTRIVLGSTIPEDEGDKILIINTDNLDFDEVKLCCIQQSELQKLMKVDNSNLNIMALSSNVARPSNPLLDNNDFSQSSEDILQVTQEIDEYGNIKEIDIKLNVPKVTYSRRSMNAASDYHVLFNNKKSKKSLKRKSDMTDAKTPERKYRKGKNIDTPKLTAATIADTGYSKEFKRLFDYYSTIKFSYSRPFHKEHIDVSTVLTPWPIRSNCHVEIDSDIDENLFTDVEVENAALRDPLNQTLAEEIEAEYGEVDISSNYAMETNFQMGFGERSGRVIQNSEDDSRLQFSAATLSDVKQSQPLLLSENYDNCNSAQYVNNIERTKREIETVQRSYKCIQMKEKVRSFFKQTMVELNNDWITQNKKYDDVYSSAYSKSSKLRFPFDLNKHDFIKPPLCEVVIQVVQVGQLPVSAAAQNPVTCDPRVTQVSDASPSQCSYDNSPNDDPHTAIKTEYTELTTADINLPLQDYTQHHNQLSMESQNPNRTLHHHDFVIEEIKEEIKQEIKEEPEMNDESSDNFDTIPHNQLAHSENCAIDNIDYTYGVTPPNPATLTLVDANMEVMYNSTKTPQKPGAHLQQYQAQLSHNNQQPNVLQENPQAMYYRNEQVQITQHSDPQQYLHQNSEGQVTPQTQQTVMEQQNLQAQHSQQSPHLQHEQEQLSQQNQKEHIEQRNLSEHQEEIGHQEQQPHNSQQTQQVHIIQQHQQASIVQQNHQAHIVQQNEEAQIAQQNLQTQIAQQNHQTHVLQQNLQTHITPQNQREQPLQQNQQVQLSQQQIHAQVTQQQQHNSEMQFTLQNQQKHNDSPEKTDQIAHAMNAAGITTSPENVPSTRAHALVNILSQKIRQSAVGSNCATNTFPKTTQINAMALQQALAQILPPPLNQTNVIENNQQSSSNTPQVLHIVQGKNASGNQITLVDNSQQSVISTPNATPVLHIVQNKSNTSTPTSNGTPSPQSNSFSGLSLVDTGLQQGNQLLHIVNAGNQKNPSASQLLRKVNLLTNLANVQGTNEQKMVQFVCKSADGKSIQLNSPHPRGMVLRLQPVESPSLQLTQNKLPDSQESSPTTSTNNSVQSKESGTSQQEIKSRSVYEENYAKFIQSSNKTTVLEKATSLPKFGQAFGKQVFQDGTQKTDINSSNSHLQSTSESPDCQANDNAISLDHIGQMGSPPLLLRKSPQTSQAQPNLVQQLKQTIAPVNMSMHGGVIYTRQIPVNIGGGQTINLITVPSTDLIDDSAPKNVNPEGMEPSIIKIVPQTPAATSDTSDESNSHISASNDNAQAPSQPVLTQMRIKLPMLSKAPQMVGGTRLVRPSFFQIQRNVIGGANQPVYQQLVLTAAPPLGQQTIRLPQTQTSRHAKTPNESQSSPESQMSSSTLEQLREFDLVLEQVKERSTGTGTAQPTSTPSSSSSFSKIQTPSTDTTDSSASVSSSPAETTQQVLYSIGNTPQLNVTYVNRKTPSTTPATSTFSRSPDSSGIVESPTSSTHQIPHTVTSNSSTADTKTSQPNHTSHSSNTTHTTQQSKPTKPKPKPRPKAASNPPNTLKLPTAPPKTSSQKPAEDEQTTQRILYILAEYKEQVENSPDKDKPAPRRRTHPPMNPGCSSKRKKSCSGSRRSGRDMSPCHGEDTCRTMGSEDSSCGTSQGDCNESCLDSHSPQDSPRKVVRKLTFENETPAPVTQPRPQPHRNVIVADGQTITVARGTAGKPATAVLMPANYILPVSMMKGGQQIAIVTNRGPKLLTVAGADGHATNALLLQRLIGPAGLKPVLTRPGVRHVRLPTTALHNLHTFNLTTATTIQPPDSTASVAPAPNPPDLVDTRAASSPWRTERDSRDGKPESSSSPEGSEPWNLPPSDYCYEETVRSEHMDRTVLVVHKKDGSSHRQHRLTHVSAAALRHKYAILEHELRLQKSLSEECEDLGVDSPSASELFPEAELLFAASPAHDHTQDQGHHSHTPQPLLSHSIIPQPDMDDQIATDQLLQRTDNIHDDRDLGLGLEDVGIVTVSEDGLQATIRLNPEEFARSHPNTTFHSEPTEVGEIQQSFTLGGIKSRHITSTILHSNRSQGTVLMTAPQTTVISQATAESSGIHHGAIKYSDIDHVINSLPGPHTNNIHLSSVLVKDDGMSRFDNLLNDSRELHLSNTASAIVHSSVHTTQVIRRVCYEDDKRERESRFLMDEPERLIAGDDAKMMGEDSSRDATLESMGGDTTGSSPERHTELFWDSHSASGRADFSSDSEKCCKSPSDETSTDSGTGVTATTHIRLDSVIKEARVHASDEEAPPLRTYPAPRSLSGKTAPSGEGAAGRRRASGRGLVKRGTCLCCVTDTPPPRPKKPRQRRPALDFAAAN